MYDKIIKHHKNFEREIELLIKYGLEILKNENKKKEEKAMLIESLLLRSCAYWESFIEEEIVYLTDLDTKSLVYKMGLPEKTKLNLKLIRALIFSDTYKNFFNISNSLNNLKKIITEEYNLFLEITPEQRSKIDFIYKLRNYLSHYSQYSKKQLISVLRIKYEYKRFQEPGLFLMKKKDGSQGWYFENLLLNFSLASSVMRKKIRGI